MHIFGLKLQYVWSKTCIFGLIIHIFSLTIYFWSKDSNIQRMLETISVFAAGLVIRSAGLFESSDGTVLSNAKYSTGQMKYRWETLYTKLSIKS